MKECLLYDRECIECGECNYCDLNPDKLCDNCGKCIDTDSEYNAVKIDKAITFKIQSKKSDNDK